MALCLSENQVKGYDFMTNTQTKENFGEQQAQAQLSSIKEMVQLYESADALNSSEALEEAERRIDESPLSVEIRSEWHTPGSKVSGGQYKILLCTGGPAVQIVGELDEYSQPMDAKLQYQDWFTPWNDFSVSSADAEILLTFAGRFYYEE